MKILHTSDWHLGKFLYRQKRYDEFEQFLNWLAAYIEREKIDALIVAGDVFDTTTPSNLAQNLYYHFLAKVANGYCRNIVITAGNHDSPSFLNAPRQVLETLNVFIVAAPSEERPEDEVIMLKDDSGDVEAIVCAVPYLRERDVRRSETGENSTDKEQALIEGIKKHYQTVCQIADDKRIELEKMTGENIPIIATGHLFTAGGKTSDGDGVRELYIGSLGHISAAIFPDVVDYAALGHLHIPQRVGGNENIRYSGSPLPLSFSDAKQEKSIVVIEFDADKKSRIETVPVPVFQRLEKIRGDRDAIVASIKKLIEDKGSCWLEVEYTGKEIIPNLKEEVEELLEGSEITLLRILNRQIIERVLSANSENETLDDLNEKDVFIRCMNEHEIPDEQQDMLMGLYKEVLFKLENPEEDR